MRRLCEAGVVVAAKEARVERGRCDVVEVNVQDRWGRRSGHIAAPRKKERKKTDNPREGWENGTPPPHRDFKERGVVH